MHHFATVLINKYLNGYINTTEDFGVLVLLVGGGPPSATGCSLSTSETSLFKHKTQII